MRINTLQQAISVTALILAAAWAGLAPASAEDTNGIDKQLLSPTLQAKNADAAWGELSLATRPPAGPAKWRDTPPTAKEKEAFYLPFVQALVGKAKDFYTRFPKDDNAGKAKLMELRFLSMTVMWGDTKQQAHLEAVEKSALNDTNMPGTDRVEILRMMTEQSEPDKVRPLLKEIANSAGPAELKAAATEALSKMKALGQPVDVQFTAVDGRSVDLSKLKGKVVLIDFWATWCGPCVGEVPNVKNTYDQFHDKGFEIVGISLDSDKDKLTQFVADHKMAWPQFFDGLNWQNKYARQFGIESIPTMWLIDKKGNLRDMNARADLSGGVQKLLAE